MVDQRIPRGFPASTDRIYPAGFILLIPSYLAGLGRVFLFFFFRISLRTVLHASTGTVHSHCFPYSSQQPGYHTDVRQITGAGGASLISKNSRITLITVILIVLPLLYTSCSVDTGKPDSNTLRSLGLRPIPEGKDFPDISFRDMNDETRQLSDFRGRVILLNFWASWCPPCRAEMPSMDILSRKLDGTDFVMIPVNVQESSEMVTSFINEFGIDFPVFLDLNGDAAKAVGVTALPTSILIDRNGNALAVVTGAFEWDEDKFISMMRHWTR